MKINLRTAIVFGVAISGLAVQCMCQAQSATSSPDKKPAQQTGAKAAPVQTALVEFPVMEGPGNGPGTSSGGAAPSAEETPGAAGTTPASSSTTATPASVTVPLKNDAMIKELAEMKKQLSQMAQMEAAVKARMARLESQLDTDPSTGDSVSA